MSISFGFYQQVQQMVLPLKTQKMETKSLLAQFKADPGNSTLLLQLLQAANSEEGEKAFMQAREELANDSRIQPETFFELVVKSTAASCGDDCMGIEDLYEANEAIALYLQTRAESFMKEIINQIQFIRQNATNLDEIRQLQELLVTLYPHLHGDSSREHPSYKSETLDFFTNGGIPLYRKFDTPFVKKMEGLYNLRLQLADANNALVDMINAKASKEATNAASEVVSRLNREIKPLSDIIQVEIESLQSALTPSSNLVETIERYLQVARFLSVAHNASLLMTKEELKVTQKLEGLIGIFNFGASRLRVSQDKKQELMPEAQGVFEKKKREIQQLLPKLNYTKEEDYSALQEVAFELIQSITQFQALLPEETRESHIDFLENHAVEHFPEYTRTHFESWDDYNLGEAARYIYRAYFTTLSVALLEVAYNSIEPTYTDIYREVETIWDYRDELNCSPSQMKSALQEVKSHLEKFLVSEENNEKDVLLAQIDTLARSMLS